MTGTLVAGTVRRGDTLAIGATPLRVREVQALGRDRDAVSGVARVALNLGGRTDELARGSVLVTPDAWHHTDTVDVRWSGPGEPPTSPVLHVGAADVDVRFRPLGPGLARLTLSRPLPLRIGDRALLRDPGRRKVWRTDVLDPDPPRLRRRGAAARRAVQLAGADGTPRLADEVARRGIARVDHLRRLGVPVEDDAGPWLVDPGVARSLAQRLPALVAEHAAAHPLDPAVPLSVLAARLRLPSPELVRPLVRAPLRVVDGRVVGEATGLPDGVRRSVEAVLRDLAAAPWSAPTADRLRDLGLDERALGAAERGGLLHRIAPGIVLAPGAVDGAVELLRGLEQPFTTSAARERLGTTRRVALPLLDHLDRTGRTRRLPDDRREVVARSGT